ncbi:hypothetical protein RZR97_09720 [Hydrogenimonas thermophila]|nr:hypothetical protein [Hydrogenimonas thermophila]WOE69383.1 hypothetical protein RZR91_09745 [Hydrogenimonas thermophila]WOE71893.1 hypothetical protein RZR97_09720 [Hydrogenimonas thermophila]
MNCNNSRCFYIASLRSAVIFAQIGSNQRSSTVKNSSIDLTYHDVN